MTEFARALVLPDLGAPSKRKLLSLLVVWDGLEVDLTESGASRDGWLTPLEEEGLITVTERPVDPRDSSESRELFDERWMEFTRNWLAPFATPKIMRESAEQVATEVTDRLVANIENATKRAATLGLAPLAITPFASLATSLPKQEGSSPVREATLIEVATRGVEVAPHTDLEDVLAFRDQNRDLMGRFRGALIDLAAAIEADSPAAAAEQAYAVVKNRVEPQLGALNDALETGRISFAWNMLLGASAVALSGGDLGAATSSAGSVAMQRLRYAFSRDRLVREHPYGLLYQTARAFGGEADGRASKVITEPRQAISLSLAAAYEALMKESITVVDGVSRPKGNLPR